VQEAIRLAFASRRSTHGAAVWRAYSRLGSTRSSAWAD